MKKFISIINSNPFIYFLGILFIFLVWFIISISQGYGNLVFPSPIETFAKTGELLTTAYIYKCIGWTILRTLIGYSISFILSFILGIFAGYFKKFYTFLNPLIVVLKSAPTAAFIFLFLIIVGSKYASIFIVILVSFTILYEATVAGIANIPDHLNDALKIDCGNFFYGFLKVRIPLAFPYLAVGLLSSFALAFKTSIMAEIISGDTNYGLGSAITSFRNSDPTNLSPIFAITLIAIILILIVDIAILILKKKKFSK
ncbi:MAG: ABC transporter permease subunit [Bacilli bacterium]|nr:ABC transporter permease subunit [Bacilli bacterium]